MLTSLDFLTPGQPWLPVSEQARMCKYRDHRRLFNAEHTEVYREAFRRIERVIGNFGEVVSYPVVLNYQKLISVKTADLLIGEPPIISCGEDNSVQQETVESIIEDNDFWNLTYMLALDISRYGDALYYVYMGEDGKGKIKYTQPEFWFPVVDPEDSSAVTNHVIAYTVDVGPYDINGNSEKKHLVAQIHYKGYYEQREYRLEGSNITSSWTIHSLLSTEIYQTGLDDFAVVPISNIRTTDTIYGHDDYTDVDSIVSELQIRISQIAKILDKHASPSVSGPSSALEQDPATREWKLKMGSYFPRDSKEDPEVNYITWDGQLEANFRHIEKLSNMLYIISEMSPTLFSDMENAGGQVTSGTAFKLRLISPLSKVARIATNITPGIEKVVKLCSQLGGEGIVNLSDEDISVKFRDGIPDDEKEKAEIYAIKTGSKQVMSQLTAIQEMNYYTLEQAEEELQKIQDEQASAMPVSLAPFSGDNELDEDEPDDINPVEDDEDGEE